MMQKPNRHLSELPDSETANFARLPKGPERLVGVGFRCWLAGYQIKDIECWETAWRHISDELGNQRAKSIVSELSNWVRALQQTSCREIEIYPAGCSGFCRDECMAIAMVAAAQQSACPALKACAFALLESSNLEGVVHATNEFASALGHEGIFLNQDSVVSAPATFERPAPVAAH